MEPIILHCDLNSFYASVECLDHPELKRVPMAVGGDPEQRHGIILAKNELAKAFGVQTAEPLWQARKKCPRLVIVPPRMARYLDFSQRARAIFYSLSDRVEPFGMDEAWIDVSGTPVLRAYGSGKAVADHLRARIRQELGITASVGVANNKVFAKLGSDMKKPDGTTVLMPEHYARRVFPQPVESLLYVGPATQARLQRMGVYTIGQLAALPITVLEATFGKGGLMLSRFARGEDRDPVSPFGHKAQARSIGNSTTPPKDITCAQEAKVVIYALCEMVASRLREAAMEGSLVQLHVRTVDLEVSERQLQLDRPTAHADTLSQAALQLLQEHVRWRKPLRSVGVRVSDLSPTGAARQLSFFVEEQRNTRLEALDQTVDRIRARFGRDALCRGVLLTDRALSGVEPEAEHEVHPIGR